MPFFAISDMMGLRQEWFCRVEVEAKAKSHLSRKGFEAQIEGATVASVLQGILDHQGTFLRGVKEDAMENVVAALAKLMEKETLREEKEALEEYKR